MSWPGADIDALDSLLAAGPPPDYEQGSTTAGSVVFPVKPPVSVGDPPRARKLEVIRASQVRPRRWHWLWQAWMVLGGLTLIAGREGLGKSTIAVGVGSLLTLGKLDGELLGQPRNILYISSEDSREHTIVPRFIAAGADMDRVLFIDVRTETSAEGVVTMPIDNIAVEALIREHNIALLILDAATSVMASGLDGHDDRKVRQFLEPLAAIGTRTQCSILGVCHFGKRESADTGKLILGSIAWSQVARSVLAVAQDPDGDLVISATKKNLSAESASIGARIVSETVETEDGPANVGRVEWLGETTSDARDHLAGDSDGGEREDRDQAVEWLREYLESDGRVKSAQAKRDAVSAGFSASTIARSRRRLGVIISSEGETIDGRINRVTYWALPTTTDPTDDERGRATTAHTKAGTTDTTGRDLRKQELNTPTNFGRASHPVHDTTDYTTDGASVGQPPKCPVCVYRLDPVLVTAGHTTHPNCEPKPCGHPGKPLPSGKCGECIAQAGNAKRGAA